MDEQASTPDSLWLVSWFIVNSPWIYAGLASGVVRLVYRWGVGRRHLKRSSVSLLSACFLQWPPLWVRVMPLQWLSAWALGLWVLTYFAAN